MDLVVTPTADWMEKALKTCRHSFDVASPFIGSMLLQLSDRLPETTEKALLTRTRLQDFAAGASSLEAVITAAERGFAVRGANRLHAKVYILDRRAALVTSANATYSGMRKNFECGIAMAEPILVGKLVRQIQEGFGAPTTTWSARDLRTLAPAVERLRRKLPSRTRMRLIEDEAAAEFDLPRPDAETLLNATAQWTQLVFRSVLRLNQEEFTTQDIANAAQADIATQFLCNRHAREKIRQQLQILRDIGLIEFVKPGHYRLLVRVTNRPS